MKSVTVILMALAVFVAAGGVVHAEDRAPDPAKRAKAEALIAETKSDGVWRADDTGEVTHIQSDLACDVSDPDDIVQLTALKVYPSAEKGTNVSCGYTIKGPTGALSHATVYAYAAEDRSDRQLLDQSIAEVQTVHSDWKPAGRPTVALTIDDNAGKKVEPLTARFAFGTSPPPMYSSIWVGVARNWAIKLRMTYPRQDEMTSEIMAIVFWASAHMKITGDEAKTGK